MCILIKDGIVLDSSKRRVGSAPLIKGLTFTEWSIGKKLPSDDDKKIPDNTDYHAVGGKIRSGD